MDGRWPAAVGREPAPVLNHIPDIVIVDRPIDPVVLRRLIERHFENMVKFVIDVDPGIAAVGGELHADGVALLLD